MSALHVVAALARHDQVVGCGREIVVRAIAGGHPSSAKSALTVNHCCAPGTRAPESRRVAALRLQRFDAGQRQMQRRARRNAACTTRLRAWPARHSSEARASMATWPSRKRTRLAYCASAVPLLGVPTRHTRRSGNRPSAAMRARQQSATTMRHDVDRARQLRQMRDQPVQVVVDTGWPASDA